MVYYRTADIKRRIGETTDALDPLIVSLGEDVDAMINTELQNHLGKTNAAGTAIIFPLTTLTTPSIDRDIQKIADDTVIGIIRDDNANNPDILERAEKRLQKHLVKRFGYSRDLPFDFTGLKGIT